MTRLKRRLLTAENAENAEKILSVLCGLCVLPGPPVRMGCGESSPFSVESPMCLQMEGKGREMRSVRYPRLGPPGGFLLVHIGSAGKVDDISSVIGHQEQVPIPLTT